MKVSNSPSGEAGNSSPPGILRSWGISWISGGGGCSWERSFQQVRCCSGEPWWILVILTVLYPQHCSWTQMPNNSERWAELCPRMEHNNEHETMMNKRSPTRQSKGDPERVWAAFSRLCAGQLQKEAASCWSRFCSFSWWLCSFLILWFMSFSFLVSINFSLST